MIRKGIIIVLTAATMLTFAAYLINIYRPIIQRFGSNEKPVAVAINGSALIVATMTKIRMPGQPAVFLTGGGGMPSVFTQNADKPIQRGPFFLPKFNRSTFPGGRGGWTLLVIPLWIPFVTFAAYPTMAFICGPLRRWRRRRKGLCLKCSYDLTGNVTGVCSECGTEIVQP